jgi:hypothetical protein
LANGAGQQQNYGNAAEIVTLMLVGMTAATALAR